MNVEALPVGLDDLLVTLEFHELPHLATKGRCLVELRRRWCRRARAELGHVELIDYREGRRIKLFVSWLKRLRQTC